MSTIEKRIEAALLQTIARCHNFNRKSDYEVMEILKGWGVDPDAPTFETNNALTNAVIEFLDSKERLENIVVQARLLSSELKKYELDRKRNHPTSPLALAILGLDKGAEFYELFQVLTRKETYKAGPYCWDTGHVLAQSDIHPPHDVTWLLIGPATRLRQGRLSKVCQERRIQAILKGIGRETKT